MALMVTLITLLLVALIGAIAYWAARRLPREGYIHRQASVKLSPRFSLNPKEHLLLDNILLLTEHIDYDDLIWHCYFSKDGDVYIRRTLLGRSVTWEHFAPNGDSVGTLKSSEVEDLLFFGKIGYPIQYLVDAENGHDLTVLLKI